jgi:hypothetical protein
MAKVSSGVWKCANWTGYHDVGHAMVIVGYSPDSYYYIDTCQEKTGCSYGNPPNADGYLGTWKIKRTDLWPHMTAEGEGYAKWNGGPVGDQTR